MFKKRAMRLGIPLAVSAVVLGLGASAAHAETNTCGKYVGANSYQCTVYQATADGDAWVRTNYVYGTGWDYVDIYNFHSGYSIIAWADQYHNGATTTVYGPYTYDGDNGPSGFAAETSVWDGGGYAVRACFKFDWATAAVHCTAWY